MGWRTRNTKSKKNLNELKKQYVKSELMNYHYYKLRWEELEERRIELNQKYEDRLEKVNAGSIIRMPDGSVKQKPWQIKKSGELSEHIQQMHLLEDNLDILDMWLDSLPEEQREIVFAYVVDRQCTDAEEVSNVTGYTEIGVKKSSERAISKIVKKFIQKCILGIRG